MKYIVLFILSLLVFISTIEVAWAQTTQPQTNPPLAKWDLSAQETKLIFADGREARLILQTRKKYKAVSKAVVKENICFPEVLPKNCTWSYEVGAYDISVVWTKNPEVSRLNQVVNVSMYGTKSKLHMTINDASLVNLLDGHPGQTQNGPILTCDSDDWLQKLPKTPSQNILVPVWAFETMTLNTISRKNENLTIFQANDLELKSIGNNTWQVVVPEGTEELERLIPVTDPNTIYYENGQNECSIQIRLEKSILAALSVADNQPIEKTYSLPLPKNIPKDLATREVFRQVQYLTRTTYTSSNVKAE